MTLTTIAGWVGVISRSLAQAYRLDPEPLLRNAGIEPGILADPLARIPVRNVQRLWRGARGATGDSALGITVAEHCHPTTFHALGYAWMASRSLRDALQRAVRYVRVATTSAELMLEEHAGSVDLVSSPMVEIRDVEPESVHAALAVTVRLCRWAAGEDFSPRAVAIATPAPEAADRFYRYFGAPLTFQAPRNSITLSAAQADCPLPSSNAELARANEQLMADYLARFDRASTAMLVRARLLERLPAGEFTEELVAADLNMSVSSLQRRLRREGTGYRQILEDMRRSLALDYVREGELPIGEITYLLGFAEPSNFTRAFRRWAGVSPSKYRALP